MDEDEAGSGVDADFVFRCMFVGTPDVSNVGVEFFVLQRTRVGDPEGWNVDALRLLPCTLVQV